MNNIKYILKPYKLIIAFILGVLLSTTTTVLAYKIYAEDINFTPTNINFKKKDGTKITNVKDALDVLYEKNNYIIYTNYNNKDSGITQYTVVKDNPNAIIITGQISLMYSINSTNNFQQINNEIGYYEDGRGLFYKSNISLKKGDTIYFKRDTGCLWGFAIIY